MLVLRFNLYLIISEKDIHEGEHLATCTLIQNLINKWCGEVILWTGSILVSKISEYTNCSIFLIQQYGV